MNKLKLLNAGVITLFIAAVAAAGTVIAAEHPLKSSTDDKDYRYFELDNSLRVLIVSDPESDRAGASLDVHVGNGSDPEGWQGLAHFLEHMLFLGTGKYPEAGEYQKYINAHGGSNNAYTSFDHTNYFFSINPAQLEPALDRFSRFFIDPTFDAVYVDRERAVVHSEYQARRKDEGRRIWAASKALVNPEHPSSRFAVGSLETLRDRDEASVREKLIEFYNEYYSANLMTLAVVGQASLDDLEAMVREKFSDISNKDTPQPTFTQSYIDSSSGPVLLQIEPEQKVQRLVYQFPIPSTESQYRSKPVSYLSSLIGHEGPGSLLDQLKKRGIADGLSAGLGFMDNVHGSFQISIALTDKGIGKVNEISRLVFENLDLIRNHGVEKWRFEEDRKLSELAFQFAEEVDAGRLAQSLSSRMHRYDPVDVLRGPYLLEEFGEQQIRDILKLLTADQVRITLVAPLPELDAEVEPFYEVRYAVEPIDAERINQWSEAKWTVDSELALPEPNIFVPERTELQADLNKGDAKPRRLTDSVPEDVQAFHKTDQSFKAPRAGVFFSIQSPAASSSAENLVMSELFVRLVNDQLNASVYPAYLAGLSFELYRHQRGYTVRIQGYEDKQSVLLEKILGALSEPALKPERLEIIKQELAREWRNVSKQSPSRQTIHEMYRLLIHPYWSEDERLAELDGVTVAKLSDFVREFHRKVAIQMLFHGDISRSRAAEFASLVIDAFPQAELIANVEQNAIRNIGSGNTLVRTMDIDHSDSALAVYFQGQNRSLEERARMALLIQMLESPYYFNLRTTERVGYLVYATSLNVNRIPGLLLSVQSPSHSPQDIDELNELFLQAVNGLSEFNDAEKFESIRDGLVERLSSKDKQLSDRTRRYWREIDLDEFSFDSRDQLIGAIESLTLDDMKSYFRQRILDSPASLIVQSPADGTAKVSEDDAIELKSFDAVREVLDRFFPVAS
ncbi:MAG: insulinase family protein [Pseudomonadota bacterium]